MSLAPPVQSRRQALLDEFNQTIAPHKLQIAQRLPSLWHTCYAPAEQPIQRAPSVAAGLIATPAAKRPAGTLQDTQPEPKRIKAEGDADPRMEELFRQCGAIVTKVWKKKDSQAFQQPVDPDKLGIPDYFKFISHPMDLRTIKEKLQRSQYQTPLQFRDDMRLVWSNCATYNQIGSMVRKMGDGLSEFWEKLWAESGIEAQWNILSAARAQSIPNNVQQLAGQLLHAVQAAQNIEPAPGAANSMTALEKRRLSVRLTELQGDQLLEVLQLVQHDPSMAQNSGQDEEVEIDLDALSNDTLLRLRDYVDGTLQRQKARMSLPPPEKRPASVAAPGLDVAPEAAPAAPEAAGRPDTHSARSESDLQDSEHASPEEVKGSTADDPHAHGGPFVRDRPLDKHVDESATAPHEPSAILRDRGPARKADVVVDAANWALDPASAEPAAAGGGEDTGDDEMWKNFQSMDEQRKRKEEEQRRLREQQEEELRKRKLAEEEEARAASQRLKEEEERMVAEQQRARQAQCDKEVDEIKASAGTANLLQQNDVALLSTVNAAAPEANLEALGLVYKSDLDNVDFDE